MPGGTLGGFSGLTPGAVQYLSDTPGLITETAPADPVPVAIATSATNIIIFKPTDLRALDVRLSSMELITTQQELAIIELRGAGSPDAIDHEELASVEYSTSGGYSETGMSVDGATTSIYNATDDTYEASKITTELSGNSMGTFGTQGTRIGYEIIVGASDITVLSLEKVGGGATLGEIYDDSSLLGSASYSGDKATFATPVVLTALGTYQVVSFGGGPVYDPTRDTSAAYPDVGAFDYNATVNGSPGSWSPFGGGTEHRGPQDITLLELGEDLVLTLPTFAGTVVGVLVIVNDVNRESGDSITYDITDGSFTDAAQALDQRNDFTLLTGNPTEITVKLTQKSSNPTEAFPSVRSTAILVFTL